MSPGIPGEDVGAAGRRCGWGWLGGQPCGVVLFRVRRHRDHVRV